MNVWELVSVLGKSLIYIGMLAAVGGMLVLWISRGEPALLRIITRQYLLPTALFGLLATCIVFLAQIGSVNQQGVAGMFDPVMGGILAETEIGTILRWRLAGFMLVLVAIIPLNLPGALWQNPRARQFSILVMLAAMLCFAVGVASQGHAAKVSLTAQFMVAVHLLAIAAWAGSFYPLYRMFLSPDVSAESAVQVAERFGQLGWSMLALMLITGITLIWQVAGGPLSLGDDDHSKLLLIKLGLVLLMMALGALHKFVLVASMRTAMTQTDTQTDTQTVADSRRLLARSIRSESLLALLVLLLTAAMTTVTGPVP